MKKNDVYNQISIKLDDIRINIDGYISEESDEQDVLFVDNSVIGSLGNFSCVVGRAKSRKTFLTSVICASAIANKDVLKISTDFPDEKSVVVYVDTEQGKRHWSKAMNRIQKMAGGTEKRLILLPLRAISTEDRINIIEQQIEELQEAIGLLVIDGIRDLMNDINSSSDANYIVQKLLKWSSDFKIHIITVLHFNKNDDNARGHLGTEIVNKAETVIQVEKDKEHPDRSIVSSQFIREKDFEKFAFTIIEDEDGRAIPELDETYDPHTKSVSKSDFYSYGENLHREVLEATFEGKGEICRQDLIPALQYSYQRCGRNIGVRLISSKDGLLTFLTNKNMIEKKDDKRKSGYVFNRNFVY